MSLQMCELGDSGLQVTRMGLGLAALGRPGYINLNHGQDLEGETDEAAMRVHAHAVLDEAWGQGVRYFDAARSYGKAEDFLGSWLKLRGIQPDAVTVGSKWGYTYTAGWQVQAEKHEVKEHSLDVLQRQWGESRVHLGPWLRLYQIHSATLSSGVFDNAPVLGELARLKGEGLRIGLSLSGAEQPEALRRALEISVEGARLFDAVQITWNLLEPSASPVLTEARAAGMGVIVKEALANGRLTDRNTDPAFKPRLELLRAQAERLGATIDALALAAVLAQPWADVVLSGAATRQQLRSNLGALSLAWDEEAAYRLSGLAEAPQTYWQTRSALAWN